MFEKSAQLIETTFKAGVLASAVPTLAIKWPNVPFRQPNSGEWVTLAVRPGSGRQDSLGTPKLERQLGLAIVQIFVPKNSGDRRARVLADLVSSIFRYKTVIDNPSGVQVVFRAPEAVFGGEKIDTYQLNVHVPFQAEALFN